MRPPQSGLSVEGRSLENGEQARVRLVWIDVLRLLCALQIVGFHWLRAGYANGFFGTDDNMGIIKPYRNLNSGWAELHYLLIDRSGISPFAILNDTLGIAFGFGWEAVNVFILLSAFTLAMNFRPDGRGVDLLFWYYRRAKRVLVPFYAVAAAFLLAAYAFLLGAHGHAGTLGRLAAKVAVMTPDSFPAAVAKHVILLDPRERHWVVDFFAPAWWFVPAILVAYLCFPWLIRLRQRLGPMVLLIGSLGISIGSYALSSRGLLIENAWYFVVTNELFSFVVGLEVGTWVSKSKHNADRLFRLMSLPLCVFAGLLLFTAGNIANWFSSGYPFSSPLYSIGFTLILSFLATYAERWRIIARVAVKTDIYKIYLLHQPLAFPIAVLAGTFFSCAAPAVGGVFYLCAVGVAVLLFGIVGRYLSTKSLGRPGGLGFGLQPETSRGSGHRLPR